MNAPEWIQQSPATHQFLADTLAGLEATPKRLPCKHFYDERGSALFDKICQLDEYYLTRAELEIMHRFAPEMGRLIGPDVRLIEYGSGSSIKTRILLDELETPVAYVPVEISRTHLNRVAKQIGREYSALEVLPVVADFTQSFTLPSPQRAFIRDVVYFPGSTIGNFEAATAQRLLQEIVSLVGSGGGLLIGIDLQKSREQLELAYNDAAGVTAAFNLNLLHRLQRELGAQLDLDGFAHHAFYDQRCARIEISIQSLREQTIEVDGKTFSLEKDERIHTEYSHKYTIDQFQRLAESAGLQLQQAWTDGRDDFAVLLLAVTTNGGLRKLGGDQRT